MDYTFGGCYKLEEEIAMGGCGTVFMGVHTVAGKEVAIKLEPAVAKHSPLRQESKIYKTLMGGPGVPWIMWSGKQGDYNVMVIDLLGPSLEDLFKLQNRRFSLKTVLLLADQLLCRIEFIHSHSFVHRDIKPANFVMGPPNTRLTEQVNVIDFGLAKKFRDPLSSCHIPYRQDPMHGVGTPLFASLNTHLGVETSRRDDLESLAYMLIYFIRGTLPWRKIRAPRQPPPGTDPSSYNPVSLTWDMIRDAKLSSEELLNAGLPAEFDVFFRYARGLEFDDLPDYAGLRSLFRSLAERMSIDYDGVFDWTESPDDDVSLKHRHGHGKGGSNSGRRTCEACNGLVQIQVQTIRTCDHIIYLWTVLLHSRIHVMDLPQKSFTHLNPPWSSSRLACMDFEADTAVYNRKKYVSSFIDRLFPCPIPSFSYARLFFWLLSRFP